MGGLVEAGELGLSRRRKGGVCGLDLGQGVLEVALERVGELGEDTQWWVVGGSHLVVSDDCCSCVLREELFGLRLRALLSHR